MKEIVHLLHTNDLHSHFENWPKIRRFITNRQKTYRKENIDFITFDLGDFMDRFHPLTDASDGFFNCDLMKQVNYDYVTIGNNEGATNSKTNLNHLYERSSATVLLANLLEQSTMTLPKWAKPYTIHLTKTGTKIGLIGLTTPINMTYHPFGWHADNPIDCLKKWLPQIKKEADVIVLLSHLGLPDDKKIAECFPVIDVIIGSHTHHLLESGLMWQTSLLAAAGRFGEYVGEVTLYLDNRSLINKEAKTFCVNDFEKKKEDFAEINHYYLEGEKRLSNQMIGCLPTLFKKESNLMSLVLDAMKKYADVDVAILNTGIVLKDLKKGKVTKKELHDCLPHPMNLIKVTLKGKDVKRLVYEIERLRDYLCYHKIVGMKFRGKIFGEMCYDGLTYCEKTKEVMWCNLVIEDEKEYELVTVDHISFLPFFPTIDLAGDVKILGPDFLRTVLGEYITTYFP